jgi:hypothetical protein
MCENIFIRIVSLILGNISHYNQIAELKMTFFHELRDRIDGLYMMHDMYYTCIKKLKD